MRVRNLSCPFCKKRTTRDKLVNHIEYNHSDQLPEGFTPLRMTFHVANNKPVDYRRPCRVCGNPTEWDEKKGRYNFLCDNPVCKEKYVAKMKASMGDKYGAYRPTATAEGLEKMLAARKISGKYKWSDGTIFDYTGSYELEALKFMDEALEVGSEDLMVPGPVLEYEYNGAKHLYITDMYYRPYNLIIEVKDGGRNVNKNKEYGETRAKQMAKEKYVITKTDYNYIRLTDKDMGQLMAVFADLKYHLVEHDDDRVIHVNEANIKHSEIFESTFLEIDDKKYNLNKLDENGENILYISGLTGAGKSTLAKDLFENYNFEYVSLDDVSRYYVDPHGEKYINNRFVPLLKEHCSDALQFMEEHDRSCYDNITPINQTHDIQRDFCNWFIETHKSNGKLYVIEGDILLELYPIEWFAKRPVIIKGQSYETACYRRALREAKLINNYSHMDKGTDLNLRNSKLENLYESYVEFCDKMDSLTDSFKKTNLLESTPMGSIAPIVGFDPEKDIVIINYMKKHSFSGEPDFAIADNPKFDTVYTRDNDGVLKKHDKKVILGSYFTPYIVRGRRESIVNALYENKDKYVDKNFIYETVFGHPMYSSNQIQYEDLVEGYEDYFHGLESIKEAITDYCLDKDIVSLNISESNLEMDELDRIISLNESYIVNEKDIYYNKDKFDSGEINLCFITGHSGSGKSTMAHKSEDKDIEAYELDDLIWNKMNFSMDNFKEYGDLFYSFFSGPGKKYYYTEEDVKNGVVKPVGDNYEKLLLNDFMSYAINYANNHKNKKFIIEGVWLVDFYKPEEFKDYAVYIKGTSLLISRWRAAKRDSKDAPKGKKLAARFKNFFNFAIWQPNIDFEKDLKKWREYYSKLESTNESVDFFEESSKDEEVSEPYFIKSKDGVDNACVKIRSYSKPFRARSSMIILKEIAGKVYVYLRKNKGAEIKRNGKYSVPGGGWEKSERPIDAAIREAQEEARINVSRVKFCGTLLEYHEDAAKWVQDNVENPNDWWYGYYSRIYVGFYNGKYTGHINERDKESEFINDSKFYLYDDVVYDLPSAYSEAIDMYLTGSYLEEAASEKDIIKNQKLEPVFVVNTFTGTFDGKLIRAAAGMKYSHALISLNSNLSPMYSFDETEVPDPKNPKNKTMYKGLVIDNFERYKKNMGFGDLRVIVIMVTKSTKKKIEEGIKYYVDKIDQTKYSYKKLVGHIIGSKEFSSFGDMAMVCSEFVDAILKYANIDISGKASANTRPDDLSTFHDRNNFFQVYEGKISQYNPSKINQMIENLKQNIEYKDLKSQTKKSMKSPFDHELGRENLIPGMVKRGGKAIVKKINKKKVLKEDGTFEWVDEILEEGGETE